MADHQRFQSGDIAAAFTLLTRIPLPVDHQAAGKRAAEAVWAYPLVGAVLGAIAALVANFALWLGVPVGITAALTIFVLALATGALHEDGIADCADGLAGGQTPQKRLSIMKDSRIGAYGAVALILVLLARWSGVAALIETGSLFWPMIAVGTVSRLPMIAAMTLMEHARNDGLSASVGRPPAQSLGLALGITLIILLISLGIVGLSLLLWVGLATLPLFLVAQRLIGGQTGDILGGSQQIGEVAALATTVALLT